MKSKITISLIVPCYNEETNIHRGVLDKLGEYTKNDTRFSEILIVDDGSTDDSLNLIRNSYLNKYPKFKLIENKHGGKAYAITTGIKHSTGSYVMFSDFDLATPIEESEKLIREVEKGFHIVIGSRSTHREGAPFTRKLLTFGSILVRNMILGLHGIKDTQCGFKIFERNVALEIIDKLIVFRAEHIISDPSVSAGFDMEFLFIAKKLKFRIKEVHVQWRHVESKRVNFFHDAIESIKDIVEIRMNDLTRAYDFSKKKYAIDIL